MKNKKRKNIKMGFEIALISQRNRVHQDKKKQQKKYACRKSKRQAEKNDEEKK